MKTPVRVAHVVGALTFGGMESIALNLMRRLPPDAVHSNVYYIGDSLAERRQEFEEVAGRFVHCPYRSPRRLDFIRRLSKAFRHDRVKAVLSYSFGNHAWVSMAARLAGVHRCYVTVQGSPMRDRSTMRKSQLLAHLARPFCSGEIAASRQVGNELRQGLRLPRHRIHIIENACNVAEIAERASRVRSKTQPNSPPVVLMVARMDDAKDHETVIKACAILIRSGHPIRLRFAGDGPDRNDHEALCRSEGVTHVVEFLGSRTDVPELLGLADIAVLSTHTEGLPIALIEALSAKVPTVATDLPVCREVLDSGHCGLLIPPRNPDALASSIVRLLKDKSLRDQLVAEAFAKVEKSYNIDSLIGRYAGLLTGDPGNLPNIEVST